MNKKTLAIFFLVLITFQVAAVIAAPLTPLFGGEGILGQITKFVFGYEGTDIKQGIVVMAVWMIIFVALSDLVAVFTAFSTFVSWIIGFGLAVIAANTGVISGMALWAFGFVAVAAAWATVLIILSALIAAVVVHTGFNKFKTWIENRNTLMKSSIAAARVKGFIDIAEEAQKEAVRRS